MTALTCVSFQMISVRIFVDKRFLTEHADEETVFVLLIFNVVAIHSVSQI